MNFDFGNANVGTDISFEVLEFADLFLGVDTTLAGSAFSLTGVTVDGAASTLGATGLSYTAGTGEAGELVVVTDGAAAYAGLLNGASRTVVVSYLINTGAGTEHCAV